MGTVIVDRYRFECELCGLADTLMVGGNRGAWQAMQDIIGIHQHARPECKGGRDTIRVHDIGRTHQVDED